jgi:uncharacterized protein (DUF1778 family)
MMTQINFRLSEEEKQIIAAMAELKGQSVAEFVKNTVLTAIIPNRVAIALDLLKARKISQKRAWILSGLSYYEFLIEVSTHDISCNIPEESWDKGLELALNFDLKSLLKKQMI